MNNNRNLLIFVGTLTLLICAHALSQQTAESQRDTAGMTESSDQAQHHDATSSAKVTQKPSSADKTEPEMEAQADINKTISSALYSKRPNELLDKQVHNSNEELVGKIEAVVSSREDGQVHVVIAKGGFMGIGATEFVVPLYGLSMNKGKLYLRATSGKTALGQEYSQEGYVSIEPENQPISEFSAFEERQH